MRAAGVENPIEAFWAEDYGTEDTGALKKLAVELAKKKTL